MMDTKRLILSEINERTKKRLIGAKKMTVTLDWLHVTFLFLSFRAPFGRITFFFFLSCLVLGIRCHQKQVPHQLCCFAG